MNIVDVVRDAAKAWPEGHVAVRTPGETLSYADLLTRVDVLREALVGEGLVPGDRVALFCPDGIPYIVASLAVLDARAVMVPIYSGAGADEVDAVIARTQVAMLVYDAALYARDGEAAPGEGLRLLRYAGERDLPAEFEGLNPAFIRFSSGTTGDSKGVLLTHEAIVERTRSANHALQITSDDCMLWVLSMSYHFVVSILLYLQVGACIRLCGDDVPRSLIDALTERCGTLLYASPFHLAAMCMAKELDASHVADLRMVISTSMKLSADIDARFAERFGRGPSEAYGIIEAGLPFVADAAQRASGSVGRIVPGYEIDLRDPNAEGVGEIFIRGGGMFSGYVSPWSRFDGRTDWFKTGDLGWLDNEGHLYIVGRTKTVINFVGMKVFPEDVEAVIDRHPAVAESFVYGRSHPTYGQIPCADVVLSAAAEVAELDVHCRAHLAPHEVPKRFRVVDDLPRTPSGKLDRSQT